MASPLALDVAPTQDPLPCAVNPFDREGAPLGI